MRKRKGKEEQVSYAGTLERMRRKRVGVLISGRGSNMRALVEAARDPVYPAEIVHVVSNMADAPGLAFAQAGISTHVVNHTCDHARLLTQR